VIRLANKIEDADDRDSDLKDAPHDRVDEMRRPREDKMPHLVKSKRDAVEDRPPRWIAKLDGEDVDEEEQQQRARNPHASAAPVAGVFEKQVKRGRRGGFGWGFEVTHLRKFRRSCAVILSRRSCV